MMLPVLHFKITVLASMQNKIAGNKDNQQEDYLGSKRQGEKMVNGWPGCELQRPTSGRSGIWSKLSGSAAGWTQTWKPRGKRERLSN